MLEIGIWADLETILAEPGTRILLKQGLEIGIWADLETILAEPGTRILLKQGRMALYVVQCP